MNKPLIAMNESQICVDIEINATDQSEVLINFVIINSLSRTLIDWQFNFDFTKEFSCGEGTVLLYKAGSHVCVAPDAADQFAPGEKRVLQIRGPVGVVRRYSDLPNGMYVYSEGESFDAALKLNNVENLGKIDALPDYGAVPNTYTGKRATLSPEHPSATIVQDTSIIPLPQKMEKMSGYFAWPPTLFYSQLELAEDAVNWFSSVLPNSLEISKAADGESHLIFFINESLADECYWLKVEPNTICVTANSSSGFFYAICSLLQLIAKNSEGVIGVGCVEVQDKPRFEYRGLMLDCARQFHDKFRIFRVLDFMAAYKLNRFHWHLTDDEGWRIEIKAFPELTDVGAWRGADEVLESQFGSGAKRYGGYYTQEDIREILEYARLRQIMVIPEIDIPGHSRAAIMSLPDLLQEPDDRSEYYSAQMYTDNVLNPALPGTYQFLHAVLDEVCDLFPAPYVHIGADEIPTGAWMGSPACNALMQERGYSSALDLQGHLLSDVQRYLTAKNRTLIGWEEASHGEKLDHSAIICAWSGTESAGKVAAAGYPVIGCPAPFAYLDMAWNDDYSEPGFHWAGTSDLSICYSYRPLAEDHDDVLNSKLIGVEALLWGELIKTQERLEYMLFPRMFAMAETAWSQRDQKDWTNFQARVEHHLKRFNQLGINHRPIQDQVA